MNLWTILFPKKCIIIDQSESCIIYPCRRKRSALFPPAVCRMWVPGRCGVIMLLQKYWENAKVRLDGIQLASTQLLRNRFWCNIQHRVRKSFCLRRSSLNRQLQVTSEGTTLRFVNNIFILPGGKQLLLYVRPDCGIDYLRFPTSKKETRLTDLVIVPSEVTCCWRFKELLRRQVQVTVK